MSDALRNAGKCISQTMQVRITSDTKKRPKWRWTLWHYINSDFLSHTMSFQMVRQMDCLYINLFGHSKSLKFTTHVHCEIGNGQTSLNSPFRCNHLLFANILLYFFNLIPKSLNLLNCEQWHMWEFNTLKFKRKIQLRKLYHTQFLVSQ